MTVQRCGWCSDDPLYIAYHDQEWGQALLDENRLFEMLCLEGQQAGLAWITVLRKREAYREHFFQYSIESIASLTDQQLQIKLEDAQPDTASRQTQCHSGECPSMAEAATARDQSGGMALVFCPATATE